ncbi:cbb3-type cytochrome c oxidase N-terminal domain-containing protein, partial [Acinetobacter baumannii]
CVWLLWWTARRRPGDPKPEDTGHVWDGNITEYNKPLPRWWINLFYLTIVFSIGYLIWYPGLGSFAGYGGWSSAKEH